MESCDRPRISSPPEIDLYNDPAHPRLKAFASIVIGGTFEISGIRIVEVGDRIIVSWPSRTRRNGSKVDVAHPVDNESRRWIERILLEAYCRELAYTREWEERTQPALHDEPPASSCGHPTEEAFFEKFDYQAAC